MHQLTGLVCKNLARRTQHRLPGYQEILDDCFEATAPPFGAAWFGRAYFHLARNREWFANSLVANSALEGYGAKQIWKFSNRVNDDSHVGFVRRHALDESRHSTMFISMLQLTFPGLSIDEQTRARIAAQQPHLSTKNPPTDDRLPVEQRLSPDETLNELIQVHITEIRALVLQYLLRSALEAYAPPENRKRLSMFTSSLIRDETAHIAYTAQIFEEVIAAGRRDFVFETIFARLRDFNDLTMVEFERDRRIVI